MKALWPCTLLVIASSTPAWAQDAAAAPGSTGTASPEASPAAPTTPAPAGSAAAGTPEAGPGQAGSVDPVAPAPAAGEAAPPSTPAPAAPPPAPADDAPAPADDAPAEPAPAPAEPAAEEPPAPAEPSRPPSETRGHFRLGARVGLAAPFGDVARGIGQLDVAGIGAGYGLDLTFGVAEDVTVGAYGDLLALDSPADCDACAPLSYGVGLLVRYHLVQGLRFDPWASYGIGIIGMNGVRPDGDGSYLGLEWLRLTVGGDWYALPNLGFGPYVELGAGSYWSVPAGQTAGGVHLRFQTGLRIVLDIPGR